MPTFEIDQIAENNPDGTITHQVQVTLVEVKWREVLSDLVRQLYRARVRGRKPFTKVMAAGGTTGLEHLDLMRDLRNRGLVGQDAPSWLLSPQEATDLANALAEAAEEPEMCSTCHERVIEQPTALTFECGRCADGRPCHHG